MTGPSTPPDQSGAADVGVDGPTSCVLGVVGDAVLDPLGSLSPQPAVAASSTSPMAGARIRIWIGRRSALTGSHSTRQTDAPPAGHAYHSPASWFQLAQSRQLDRYDGGQRWSPSVIALPSGSCCRSAPLTCRIVRSSWAKALSVMSVRGLPSWLPKRADPAGVMGRRRDAHAHGVAADGGDLGAIAATSRAARSVAHSGCTLAFVGRSGVLRFAWVSRVQVGG